MARLTSSVFSRLKQRSCSGPGPPAGTVNEGGSLGGCVRRLPRKHTTVHASGVEMVRVRGAAKGGGNSQVRGLKRMTRETEGQQRRGNGCFSME